MSGEVIPKNMRLNWKQRCQRVFLVFFASVNLVGCCLLEGTVSALAADASDAEMKRAVALYQGKDYRNAMTAFHKIATARKTATPTYYLGMCYLNLKYHEQAVDVFKRVTSQWPDSPEAKRARSYLKNLEGIAAKIDEANATIDALKEERDAVLPPSIRALGKVSREAWAALPAGTRIPFTKERGHMWVVAKINGRSCKVVFDTGASLCIISQRDFPDIFSQAELNAAPATPISRPWGISSVKNCKAEIELRDIKRTVRLCVTQEPGVSVIGQNFFKEFSYGVDDFYIRLTKEPYKEESGKTRLADVAGSVAANQKLVSTLSSAKNKSATDAAMLLHEVRTAQKSDKSHDKFSLPFEKSGDVMLVDIEVNGVKAKACFDTGCAVDGLVLPPAWFGPLKIDYHKAQAERLVVGHISKRYVKCYPANGLPVILIGPKIFDRGYKVDQKEQCIKFDY